MSEASEARAQRRRWLTLAELVGVIGLVIAGLGLWTSWSGERDARREKAAERAESDRARSALLLVGAPSDGGRTLTLADADHRVQRVAVRFPTALGAAAHEALVDPRIEADWIAAPLLKLTDGSDAHEGRVPVLITADWWDADAHRTSRAIYELVWRTEGRFLRGRALRLEGVTLRERGGTPARVDAIWAREKPA